MRLARALVVAFLLTLLASCGGGGGGGSGGQVPADVPAPAPTPSPSPPAPDPTPTPTPTPPAPTPSPQPPAPPPQPPPEPPAPPPTTTALIVDSAEDGETPPAGKLTLRAALAAAAPGQTIAFHASLDGRTIPLTVVADEHTQLTGEVMGMRDGPGGPVSYLVGWFPRDYGRSALYVRKDVVIDASSLPRGITIAWAGGEPGARVLAVAGDLTLVNVAITGGRVGAQRLATTAPDQQPWTLARGGGLAVWGTARLKNCRLYDNALVGDFEPSRDRGAYGGGIYADRVQIEGCTISGNSVRGGGAAGGGVYVVGGVEWDPNSDTSTISRSAVTGNRIEGLYAYGGGVYTDGGGIDNGNRLQIETTTIARNVAGPAPGLPSSMLAQGYWRGGGIYMSNGRLVVLACTVVENETRGTPRTDSLGRRNLAGGIAATVGNAHTVEHMVVAQSIVAGNAVVETGGARYEHDLFTGSLFEFRSGGHNRLGVVDFSQMLVPVAFEWWDSTTRRHYPQPGDRDRVGLDAVLDVATAARDATIASKGTDAGEPVVLRYAPRGDALDTVPGASYTVTETLGEFRGLYTGRDTGLLPLVLARVESRYGLAGFAAGFTAEFEAWLRSVDADPATAGVQPYRDASGNPILTLAGTVFTGTPVEWPRELANVPYIEFWHRLDAALLARAAPPLTVATLNDAEWMLLFPAGPVGDVNRLLTAAWYSSALSVPRPGVDQVGTPRPAGSPGDVGAIER